MGDIHVCYHLPSRVADLCTVETGNDAFYEKPGELYHLEFWCLLAFGLLWHVKWKKKETGSNRTFKIKVVDDIPFLGTYLKDSKSVWDRDTLHFHVPAALLTTVKMQRTLRCLSINRWWNKGECDLCAQPGLTYPQRIKLCHLQGNGDHKHTHETTKHAKVKNTNTAFSHVWNSTHKHACTDL